MKKKIGILGSTGSIGRQTLEVVDQFEDKIEVVALTAGNNADLLIEQSLKYKPQIVAVADENTAVIVREALSGESIEVYSGAEGLNLAATYPPVDILVTSIVGTAGLIPTIEAIKAGKTIALANKETLVAAGSLVMGLARDKGVRIMPVDSEHSAIFQSLTGSDKNEIKNILLTASGGPFRGKDKNFIERVTPKMALRHPNWDMGAKITIDSATLMNKGLEVIEARWLFNVDFDQIKVLVHPQSIIHSMIEFIDGSVIGQMGLPDMRLPIQYALTYPERWGNNFPKLNFLEIKELTFEEPDTDVFPALKLAYTAGKTGGTMPAVMNAANEILVNLFLNNVISFIDIPRIIEEIMEKHNLVNNPSLEEILAADAWARREALAYRV